MNDDISGFPYGWLAALQHGLYARSRYGIAGPSGKSSTRPACDGQPGMSGLQTVQQLSFWCVLVKRAMIDDIGLLDERFIHYGSDNEYCHRARWASVWSRASIGASASRFGRRRAWWSRTGDCWRMLR